MAQWHNGQLELVKKMHGDSGGVLGQFILLCHSLMTMRLFPVDLTHINRHFQVKISK